MAGRIMVTRPSMPDYGEYCEEIRDLWESRWLTNMGTKHEQLQRALEARLGCPHVVLHANGHLALENAIAALGLPRGAEVITTPLTFASTTHAIARNGLTPVFCDVREDDFTLDADALEALVTERTAAIVPVHLYGNLCDVEKIDRVAKAHGLKVVYDAAHAFGVKYKGASPANFGDASMFSFHATKVFNTIEGGAVCTRDERLVQALNDLKNFGIRSEECVAAVGGNAKMNEFQAAMGLCNLRRLDGEIRKRGQIVRRYRRRLEGTPGLRLCAPREDVEPNHAFFPVVFDGFGATRDQVYDALARHDIFARKYYSLLTNSLECYRRLPTGGPEATPVAARLAARGLSLPLYADLAADDVDRICDIVLSCRKQREITTG